MLIANKAYFRPIRAHSRPLLGATITPNLAPWVLKEVFWLEMIKMASVLGVEANKMPFFLTNVPPKNASLE